MRKFLNRLLSLRVEAQALLFAYYAACLGAEIRRVGFKAARRHAPPDRHNLPSGAPRTTPGRHIAGHAMAPRVSPQF